MAIAPWQRGHFPRFPANSSLTFSAVPHCGHEIEIAT
jgi:hypothetical protein